MLSITKDSIFYSQFGLTENRDNLVEIQPTELLKFLGEPIEFEDGLTFGRLFGLLIQNKALINLIFNSTLGGFNFQSWVNDFNQECTDNSNYDVIFTWGTEYYDYRGKVECEIYPMFKGFGSFVENCDEKDNLSLGLTKLCNLKNKKVKIDPSLIIYDLNQDGFVELINSDMTNFKLFDIIYSILYEISFHGEPNNRDEFAQSLEELSEDIDIESARSIEDVMDELGITLEKPIWRRGTGITKTKTFVNLNEPKILHIIETGWVTPKMYSVVIENGETGVPELEFLNAEQILEKFQIDVT